MFERLPGFRDFYPEDCSRRNYLFQLWAQSARRFGFQQYDIPTLEPLELFTEKSGPEIVGQLFNFEDKGGRQVSLRPELTPSLARMIGAKANSLKRPIKWFNVAENFRYEKQQRGRLRSHYQYNCDVFGEPGTGADAELIACCIESLRAFGLNSQDFVLRLSDRNLWVLFLESRRFTEEAIVGILGVIDKYEKLDREALIEMLTPWCGEDAKSFLDQVDALLSIRSIEALSSFFTNLALEAEFATSVDSRLSEWNALLSALEAMGLTEFIRIDLGIVRGLAYYTGFVFEVFELENGSWSGRALAGGGRYDHLVAKLGYGDLPAVGFGMGDVTLTDLLEKKGLFPDLVSAPDIFVVAGGEQERLAALKDVASLRSSGLSVEYPLKAVGFGKQFKLAGQSGAKLTLVYGSEEIANKSVKIKDMATGREESVPSVHLVAAIHDILAEGWPEEAQ